MFYDGSADPQQLAMLTKVLNDYCSEAGIPDGHAAKEHFGRRLMSLPHLRSGAEVAHCKNEYWL